jgi:hypothetical protein
MEDKVYFFDSKDDIIRDIMENYAPSTCRNEITRLHICRCWALFDFGFLITNPKYIPGTNFRDYELIAFIFCDRIDRENRVYISLACVNENYKRQCSFVFQKLIEYCRNINVNTISIDVEAKRHKLIFYYESLGFYQIFDSRISIANYVHMNFDL